MTETITRRKFIGRCTTLAAGALAVEGSGSMSYSGPAGRIGAGLPKTHHEIDVPALLDFLGGPPGKERRTE
jgi:hypothetical protein